MLVSPNKKLNLLGAVAIALASSAAIAETPQQMAKAVAAQAATQAFPSVGGATNGARPDIAALRYYATRGEQGRVSAEIRRLKVLYPGWQQPENIFSDQSSDEKQLWNLFSTGSVKAVKTELAKLSLEQPGFQPTQDLLDKLQNRETRDDIAAAHNAQQWNKVVKLTNESPALLMGGDVELIWFLAEAYARLERPAEALEAFTAAFSSAKTPNERKATMEKAAALLSTEAALTLLEATELNADQALKGHVEDAIVRGALARSAETGEEPPAILSARIDAFAAKTRLSGTELDATLLAWAHFGRREWKAAHEWFSIASKSSNDPKVIEGTIMASKRAKKLAMAEDLATKWQDASPEIGALYLGIKAPLLLQTKPQSLPQEFLSSYAAKTIALQSGEGSEALGWYAYNVKQLEAARAWFQKAAEWELTETAIYGQALSAARMKDRLAFNELKEDYSAKFPKVAALKYAVEVKRRRPAKIAKRKSTRRDRAGKIRLKIARIYKAKRYGECLRMTRKLRGYGPLRAGDHQMRGWCLLGSKRPSEAQRAFAAAVRLGGKGKTPSAYGQSLAALRSGKTNEALDIANSNGLTKKQRRVVDVELLTQRARAAFNNKDYAASIYALDKRAKLKAESRDLTMMRGWSHYHGGNRNAARQIFAVLDQQLSTRETRRGISAVDRKHNELISQD